MKLIDWFRGLFAPGKTQQSHMDGNMEELILAYNSFRVRELAFWCCTNMIASAVARCEFRTFQSFEDYRGAEYYMWNVEPSVNESSTAFLHHMITNLYRDNEALLIFTKGRGGRDGVVVADSWSDGEDHPSIQHTYKNVVVGDTTYNKTFYEDEVVHLRLNGVNMRPITTGIVSSFEDLIAAAAKSELWKRGQHWKVHIDRSPDGKTDDEKVFRDLLNDQFKPFLNNLGAVLPEFTGYKYENVSDQAKASDTRDIRSLFEDVFDMTARAFRIPVVLMNGKIEGTEDANTRFLTEIDGLCDQIGEEITRKRYSYSQWKNGTYLQVDSSSIMHFDIFKEAANVEKLVGSGAYSVNDVRRASGQTIINAPWANEHYLTKNIGTLATAAEALAKGENQK